MSRTRSPVPPAVSPLPSPSLFPPATQPPQTPEPQSPADISCPKASFAPLPVAECARPDRQSAVRKAPPLPHDACEKSTAVSSNPPNVSGNPISRGLTCPMETQIRNIDTQILNPPEISSPKIIQ